MHDIWIMQGIYEYMYTGIHGSHMEHIW
jgi:hypothetical protein